MSFKTGHALIIGVGTHANHPELDVPITVADATAVKQTLEAPDWCGYPSQQVTFLAEARATQVNILAALDQLSYVSPEATVFIFFAGHGGLGTDGNYHLLSHDVRVSGERVISGTAVSEASLLQKLRAIPAERCFLIFNACHSAHIGSQALGTVASIPSYTLNLPRKTTHALLGTGAGRILIVASKADQCAYFTPGEAQTVFTKALLDGLRGGAVNRQGYVGAFGLYEYLYHEVREMVQMRYQRQQEPVLTAIHAVGSFPIALYRGASLLGLFAETDDDLADTAVDRITVSRAQRTFNQSIGIDTGNRFSVGGDYIEGDKIGGDKVAGDKISVSGGGALAWGDKSTAVGAGGVVTSGSVSAPIVTGSGNIIHMGGRDLLPDPTVKNLPAVSPTLRPNMLEYLSRSEIKTIAFDMQLDYDRLAGETLDEKVLSLIRVCQQKDRLAELVTLCRQTNSAVDWT